MWLGLLASHEYNLESCENKSLKLNIYLSSIFTYNVYDLCIHAGYLSPKVQRYNFKYNFKINQLKPVQAVTGHDEHLPLFHFCKHHLWPKLADYSDQVNVIWSMYENAQKFEWKHQSKISLRNTWLFQVGSLVDGKFNDCNKKIRKGENGTEENKEKRKSLICKSCTSIWILAQTKGMLSCCKCLFDYKCIAANLAYIHAENVSNIQKCVFGNGLM